MPCFIGMGCSIQRMAYSLPWYFSTLHPVLKSYSRWDTSLKGLSKVGKQLKSDKIVVYTLNKNLFRVNK